MLLTTLHFSPQIVWQKSRSLPIKWHDLRSLILARCFLDIQNISLWTQLRREDVLWIFSRVIDLRHRIEQTRRLNSSNYFVYIHLYITSTPTFSLSITFTFILFRLYLPITSLYKHKIRSLTRTTDDTKLTTPKIWDGSKSPTIFWKLHQVLIKALGMLLLYGYEIEGHNDFSSVGSPLLYRIVIEYVPAVMFELRCHVANDLASDATMSVSSFSFRYLVFVSLFRL